MGWEVTLWSHTWVPGAQQHLETGRASKKAAERRWGARRAESTLMSHDVDALIQECHCTEILCPPENTKTRTFHSFLFVHT